MIELFKDLFRNGGHGQVIAPDKNYERLMENMRDDEAALLGVEQMVHDEFRDLGEDVQNIGEGVDKIVGSEIR